jgi:hypothetical protein
MHLEAQVVTEPAKVDARTVYEYASQMTNLPQWASGLSSGIAQRGDQWITQSPMGEVTVAMAAKNEFGVMDHDVTLPDGTRVHNAFRVTPAGSGSLLAFVVLRMPGTSQEAFEADVAHVRKDLKMLRQVLEARS